jgi:hypothetical protein
MPSWTAKLDANIGILPESGRRGSVLGRGGSSPRVLRGIGKRVRMQIGLAAALALPYASLACRIPSWTTRTILPILT